MTTDRDFMQAITEAPDDDAPRAIYADWLDEQGRVPLATSIRAGLALARAEARPEGSPADSPEDGERDEPTQWEHYALWARAANALDAVSARTEAALDGRAALAFDRGLPALLSLGGLDVAGPPDFDALGRALPTVREAWLDAAPTAELLADVTALERAWPDLDALHFYELSCFPRQLPRRTPVRSIHVRGPNKQSAWLRASPALERVTLTPGARNRALGSLRLLDGLEQLRTLYLWCYYDYQLAPGWRPPQGLERLVIGGDEWPPEPELFGSVPGLRNLGWSMARPMRGAGRALEGLRDATAPWLQLTFQGESTVQDQELARVVEQVAAMPALRGFDVDLGTDQRDPRVTQLIDAVRPEALRVRADDLRAASDGGLERLRWLSVRGVLGDELLERLMKLPLVYLELHRAFTGLGRATAPELRRLLQHHPTLNVLVRGTAQPDDGELRSPRADLYVEGPGIKPCHLMRPRCDPGL